MDKDMPQFTTQTPYHAIDMMTGTWYDFSTYPFTTNYQPFVFGKELSLSESNTSALFRFGQRNEENTSISFQTKPFTEEMVIAGPGSVRLLATTSSKDMTFLVELLLVDEKGIKTRITQGNVIASLSQLSSEKSWKSGGQFIRPHLQLTQEMPVISGKEYVLEFPMAPRLATIQKGHRLEVLISSMPKEEDCKGNLGVFPCLPTEQQLARLQGGTFEIKLNGAVSSRILLPVIPKGKMKASNLNYDSSPNHPF
jgi:predicted acyl esterase